MPDPAQLEGTLSWRKALAIAFSVGIRPCTGAILIMIFALSQGLLIAGIFATFAMALGTAITVSTLAALAVGSRELATRLAGGESRFAGAVATGAGLVGSALVFLMGASFFVASLGGATSGPL
jgi:nickel/cobalt exporter